MEIINIDDILKQATDLKNEISEDKAIAFLIFTIKDNDIVDFGLIRLLKKIKTYIRKSNIDIQSSVIQFYENLAKDAQRNNKISEIDFYEEYADLLNLLGKYSEAEMYISGAIASASPFEATNYLNKASQLYEKRAITILSTNRKEPKKSIDNLYYHLGGHLLTIAWHLFVDGKTNIQRFITSQYSSSLGFKNFEIFHNIKDSGKLSQYPFENEQNKKAFELISNGKNIQDFCIIFQNIAFNEYPASFGFTYEFLNPDFKDLKKFATSFANEHGEINFEAHIPSAAVIAVDEFINNFLRLVSE